MVSIIIPARNEPFLQNTINDCFRKAKGDIEIIAVLDGYWPDPIIEDNPKVHLIHFSEPKGMRPAINAGANLAKGEFIIKCDAHCAFQDGFDVKLVRDYQPNWTLVPVRYELDVDKWTRTDKFYEFQYIEKGTLKGRNWPEYKVEGRLVDLMTSQGSFWFMSRDRFFELGGLDDVNYGVMGREAQEVCLKTWTSGGRYVLDRNTWYAHWNKPSEFVIGGMKKEKEKSKNFAVSFWTEDKIRPIIDRFGSVPTWEEDKIETKGMARANLYELFAKKGFTKGAEVGVWRAANAEMMFSKIPNLFLYLVDPYIDYDLGRVHRGEERLKSILFVAEKRMKDKNVTWLKMFSEDAYKQIADESLDFVYIDGNHTYDFAMLDILLWERKVRKGGIVSGHDYYNDSKHNMFVRQAVDDYCKHHKIDFYVTDSMAEPHGKNARASWFWIKK
jgi:glycosyltransferase involved in cell wall biosynthesis